MRSSHALAAVALLLTASACGGSGGGSDESPDESDPRADESTASAPNDGPLPADGVPPTLDWSPDLSAGPAAKPCGGKVRCVGPDGEFATISEAVDSARDGDTVQVASGTYAEQVVVEGKQVTLLGGFTEDFTSRDPAAEPTVVDAEGAGTVVVLREASDSMLDGFTITGGKAPLGEYDEAVGSGILVDVSGDVTISHNLVAGNDDGFDVTSCGCNTQGGGLFADSWKKGATITIVANIFRDNSAHWGAAIFAGIPAMIEGNLIEDNVGRGDHGGGLYLGGDGTVLRQNLVRNNQIGSQAGYGWGGGGIFTGSDAATKPAIHLEGNRWVGNFAPGRGSGFFIDEAATGTIVGDLFHDNICGENGAGVYLDGGAEYGSEAHLENVTITRSECALGSNGSGIFAEGGSRIDLVNSVVAGNGGDSDLWQCQDCQSPPPAAASVVTYSLIGPTFGEITTGDGVIDGSPDFVDAGGGDFHLADDSPARGAADDGTDLGTYR
jgi:hypothetical protein